MFEQLETLRVLHEVGTTGRAATRLRVSQSAVSKRVAALEGRLGVPLVEKVGRRVRLTGAALRLLEDVGPLLREVEARVSRARGIDTSVIRVAATESLLGAWLPGVLRDVSADVSGVSLALHAHRGPVALDRVRAGEVDLAVVVEGGEAALRVEALGEEPMVLVPSGLARLAPAPGEVVPVWTIEAGSLTGAWLARRLPRWSTPEGWRVAPEARIESFASAVQLARAGFGHALVPGGLARSLGVSAEAVVALPGLARPVVVCGRPSAWERPSVAALVAALARRVGEALGGYAPSPGISATLRR